jgi:hypothetical protein
VIQRTGSGFVGRHPGTLLNPLERVRAGMRRDNPFEKVEEMLRRMDQELGADPFGMATSPVSVDVRDR